MCNDIGWVRLIRWVGNGGKGRHMGFLGVLVMLFLKGWHTLFSWPMAFRYIVKSNVSRQACQYIMEEQAWAKLMPSNSHHRLQDACWTNVHGPRVLLVE